MAKVSLLGPSHFQIDQTALEGGHYGSRSDLQTWPGLYPYSGDDSTQDRSPLSRVQALSE